MFEKDQVIDRKRIKLSASYQIIKLHFDLENWNPNHRDIQQKELAVPLGCLQVIPYLCSR
jgi:hypothetical protein